MAEITPETYWQGIQDGALDAGILIKQVVDEIAKSAMYSKMTKAFYGSLQASLHAALREVFEPLGITVINASLLRFAFETPGPQYIKLWSDREPVLTKRFRIYGSSVHDAIDFNFDYDPFRFEPVPQITIPLEVEAATTWEEHAE